MTETSDMYTSTMPQEADLSESGQPAKNSNIDLLMDINLRVVVELARTQMQLRQVMDLQDGSVVELDRLAGDPVDVYINDRLFAKAEVIVVDDNFGIRITELISVNR
jgi:flagellar motor switch protein FliN/FliY